MPIRVIVSGDRNWTCDDLARRVVARLIARFGADFVVVHGGASGVDGAFAEACDLRGATHEPHVADWRKHGKGAGPRRNQEMIDSGADFIIAVHRSLAWSKGTKDLVERGLKAGIPVYLIDGENAEPRRIREVPEKKGGDPDAGR